MLAYLLLAGAIVRNLSQHRRGKPTMCGLGRRILPGWLAMSAWAAFNAWFIPHWLRGYSRR